MSIARHHAEWLALIDISGPFLSLRALAQAFPQGLDAPDADVARELRLAYEEWLDNSLGTRPDVALHLAWVEWVLRRVLGQPAGAVVRDQGSGIGDQGGGESKPWQRLRVSVPEHGEVLRPDYVIVEPSSGPIPDPRPPTPRVLVQVVPAGQDLERAPARAAWQASPATRMMTLLRGAGVRLGLLTNGEQWMLVDLADENLTTGFASWYARLWLDEPITLRAFRSLLGAQRLFGVPDAETLEALLAASVNDRQEVTDQLGYQVRRAVDLLVQALDLADQNEGRRLLREVPPERLYEASLTVMMRLVFLLFAEEQSLLLLGDDVYDRNYAASTLLETLREAADRVGEEVLARRYDAWGRLLAIFRAVYGGFRHDRLTMPAYGGRLFDPDRYPFLEGRAEGTSWQEQEADPPQISNRTVLHLLEALQVLRMRVRDGAPIETRRLSFRALDIEQIGHVYEGLLDHTALRAAEPILGLAGTRDQEPEIALATLEAQAARGEPAFLAYLQEQTGRSASALKKAHTAPLDAFRATLLRTACGNDEALYARVLPFAGLVRDDDYGRPAVIPAGSVYVTAGAERRATGTHYTPRSLTEPIVQHTLEPLVYHGPAEGLPREEWRLHPAAKLLQLTVCDMAMGSGAFLVQACRYLAERLLEAWAAAEGAKEGERRLITPEGFPTLEADEAVPADPDERLVFARRLVADRCLYGVDKNPLAAEMAKLSLWLITLAKGRPFSFLDHALRAGDSLLGIADLEQLTRWSLRKDQANPNLDWVTGPVEKALRRAFALRREIRTLPTLDARDADLKREKLAQAEQTMALIRLGADLLVAAALAPDPRSREERRGRFLSRYAMLLRAADEGRDTAALEAELRADAEALLQGRRPFHWPLEFPEVFVSGIGDRGSGIGGVEFDALLSEIRQGSADPRSLTPDPLPGFAAIVGNPPFLGGKRISTMFGIPYNDYLQHLHPTAQNTTDLVAHFLLRGYDHLKHYGCIGLITTNTIAQGDTRAAGLEYLMAEGANLYRAQASTPWPGVAAVFVSLLHLQKGEFAGKKSLNGQIVENITAFLEGEASTVNPHTLLANSGRSFIGVFVRGMGFVLGAGEAQHLLTEDPRSQEVVKKYLSGEDLNTSPDQSPTRYVISFANWPIDVAKQHESTFRIVQERVFPERQKVNQKDHRDRWWQFANLRPGLENAIKPLQRVLTVARVSRTVAFVFVPKGWVYNEKVVVFPFDKARYFALLQSAFHNVWAWRYSSTLKADLNYAPSDCFETYPFPAEQAPGRPIPLSPIPNPLSLDLIGEKYHQHRQEIMLRRQEGLTKTYNRFHNPKEHSGDIEELRRLHIEMDNAVAAAYGWGDLTLGHGFHETKQGLRYTISEAARREVLDRLLRLNHERYAEEVAAGLHEKKGKGSGDRGQGIGDRQAKASTKRQRAAQPAADGGASADFAADRRQLDLFDASSGGLPAAQVSAGATPLSPIPYPLPPTALSPEPRTLSPEPYTQLTALLEQRGALTNGDVQAALGLDAEAARALLRRLVEEGRAAVEGQKRGTRYVRRDSR